MDLKNTSETARMTWQRPEKMAFCLPAPSNTSDMSCMMAPVAAAAEMLSRHPMATYELRHTNSAPSPPLISCTCKPQAAWLCGWTSDRRALLAAASARTNGHRETRCGSRLRLHPSHDGNTPGAQGPKARAFGLFGARKRRKE